MLVTLVTGTSSGIGLATSLHFARQGHRVYATMRNPDRGDALRAALDGENLPVELLKLDVTDADSIRIAVGEVVEREKRVDVLVNNAGIGGSSALEETPDQEHRAAFDTNYFGAIDMMKAVLPSMREQHAGTIVNVTSVAGVLCIPAQVPYSASKHALEAASEALAHEVRPHGIRVAIIEPGVFGTQIFENSAGITHYDRASPYRQVVRRNIKMYMNALKSPGNPERVAEVILHAVTTDQPKLRYLVGDDAERMVAGRAQITDEEWVDLGRELSDEQYAELYKRALGIEIG